MLRRHCNNIAIMKNAIGQWGEEKQKVLVVLLNHFCHKWKFQNFVQDIQLPQSLATIIIKQNASLMSYVIEEDIIHTVHTIALDKVPGCTSWFSNFLFFKLLGPSLKRKLFEQLNIFLQCAYMYSDQKWTYVALILKTMTPLDILAYCLYNTIYKIIAIVIVNHPKLIMLGLISSS